jgi:hypothetical protein
MWRNSDPNLMLKNYYTKMSTQTCPFIEGSIMGSKAIAAFCEFIDPLVRQNCLIQALQYAIDMYGAANAGYSDRTCSARPAILLAGWLFNDLALLGIDRTSIDQITVLESQATAGALRDTNWFMDVSGERLNAAFRFSETFAFRRISGRWGDPNLTNSDYFGERFTDPDTNQDIGIGWLYKHRGRDGNGIPVFIAGSTSNTTGIVASAYMGGSKSHVPEHAYLGLTLYAETTPTNYFFPKTVVRLLSPYTGYMESFAVSTPNEQAVRQWKNVKMKVISGPGASDTVYRIVSTSPNLHTAALPPSSISGLTFGIFRFDKPWSNGVPDSSSKVVFYPFDSDDIGTVVMRGLTDKISVPNNTILSGTAHPAALTRTPENLATRGPYTSKRDDAAMMNILKWYGLVYALGKRNPKQGLIDTRATRDVCDGVICNVLGNEPFNFCPVGDLSAAVSDINTTTTLFSHACPDFAQLGSMNGFSGILRQLWERTLPR